MNQYMQSVIETEWFGERLSLRQIARNEKIPYATLWRRTQRIGMSVYDAVELAKRPKAEKRVDGYGYVVMTGKGGRTEHIEIATAAIGRPLNPGEEVHHVNGRKDDNSNVNLVICQSRAYHMLLHRRTRSLETCGYANYEKCDICGKYDNPEVMYSRKDKVGFRHRSCSNIKRASRKYQEKINGN